MHEKNLIHWIGHKLGLDAYLNEWVLTFLSSFVVFLVIVVLSLLVSRSLKREKDAIVPSERLTFRNIIELFIEWFLGVMKGVIGERAERFFPLIGSLFIYIFLCNLLGFIPGLVSPTTVITTNLACALIVFFYYNYVGIREKGFLGYLRHFLGPVIWLAPLFFFIELTSHLVRPISLSVRLYGNMVGDHMVIDIFSGLVPLVIPIFFIVLGLFISFIQAFVFAILSTVYIALAVEHE